MSKSTILIAAASASVGAGLTALLMRPSQSTKPITTSTPSAPLTNIPSTTTSTSPPIFSQSDPVFQKSAQETRSIVNPAGWFAYGSPGPVNDFAKRSAFMSSYDRRMRNPAWVAEHITPESLGTSRGDRKNSAFLEDEAVPEKFRGKLKDYFKSGYDRGHQVPAADAKYDQAAMDETFYLTNMCPQVGEGFNRDYWAHFEDFCRKLTKQYPSVRIVTGPLYLPKREQDGKYRVSYEVIGSPPSIAVPTHFYKVIVAEGQKGAAGPLAVGAFVLPNARIDNSTPLTAFSVPVEIVERASGLDFLSALPTNQRKSLCSEVNCSIVVREFAKNVEKGGRK